MDIKLLCRTSKDKIDSIYKINNLIILSLLAVFLAYYFFKPSILVLSFVLNLVLLKFFAMHAFNLGLVDFNNSRSAHKHPTPSSAGITFFLAAILASLFSDLSIYHEYTYTILGTFSVLTLGFVDDLKNIRARHKILVISTATLLACSDGFIINDIGSFFGYSLSLYFLAIPITIFLVVGFTNSLNLIDGLDGLAASISTIILASLWYIGYQNSDPLLLGVSSLLISALIAFLFYNWNPAKMFMGDSGSLSLGFVISILGIRALEYVDPMVIIFLVALPVIDTIVVILKRRQYGQPVFSPDQNHMHHVILLAFNKNVKKTVITLAAIQLLYAILGLLVIDFIPQELAILFFIINIVIWYLYLTSKCENHLKRIRKRQLNINI